MLMEEGLDTGPILMQSQIEIGDEETAGELADRLAVAGAALLIETLDALDRQQIEPRIQDHAAATLAPRLTRDDGIIDWRQEARRIFDRLRGLTPWPGVASALRGEPVKILWGKPIDSQRHEKAAPGTFVGLVEGRLGVACGGQSVFGIELLQMPGRKALPADVFIHGQRLEPGERFG